MAGGDYAAVSDHLTRELLVIFMESPKAAETILQVYEASKCITEVLAEDSPEPQCATTTTTVVPAIPEDAVVDVASGEIKDSTGAVIGIIDPVTGDITDPISGEVLGKTDGSGNITEVT